MEEIKDTVVEETAEEVAEEVVEETVEETVEAEEATEEVAEETAEDASEESSEEYAEETPDVDVPDAPAAEVGAGKVVVKKAQKLIPTLWGSIAIVGSAALALVLIFLCSGYWG